MPFFTPDEWDAIELNYERNRLHLVTDGRLGLDDTEEPNNANQTPN